MKTQLNVVIAPEYASLKSDLEQIETLFENASETIQENRNTIKVANVAGNRIAIKSFKNLGVIRGFIYRYFRPSKAKRSYEYARKLTSLGFSTPKPIAYIEERNGLCIRRSYFISRFLDHDFLIKDILNKKVDNYDNILDKFVSFTFDLHDANVLHLDHSPGNTLITAEKGEYTFSLVDINRMSFERIPLKKRLENFTRLTQDKAILEKIAHQYAKLAGQEPSYCFDIISNASKNHFKKLDARRKLKRLFRIKKN